MRILTCLFVAASIALAQNDPKEMLQDGVKAFREGDYEQARTLFGMVLVADPQNQTAQNFMRQIAEKQARSAALTRRLDSIVLQKVEFNDVSAREAVDFVVALTNRNAPEGFHLNMVWMVPEDFAGTVTLSLADVPAAAALGYVVDNAGLALTVDEHAVKVHLPKPRPPTP